MLPPLRILPPGGGEPPPDDPDEVDELVAMVGPLADAAFELADKIRIPAHRRFVEHFVRSGDSKAAVVHAFPSLGYRTASPTQVGRGISNVFADRNVAEYIRVVRGVGAFTAGMDYRATLLAMQEEGARMSNPPYVRVAALGRVIDAHHINGVAAAQGFAISGEGSSDAPGDELPDAEADFFLDVMAQPRQLPESPGEGEG